MFEKFGEFDSAEELNRAALAQRNEGDAEAVRALAEENGLDPEDAEEFLAGDVDFLALPFNAAVGKLTVERKELRLEGVLADWTNDLIDMCSENIFPEYIGHRKNMGHRLYPTGIQFI